MIGKCARCFMLATKNKKREHIQQQTLKENAQ